MSISLYKFMVNILSTLQGVMPMPLPEGKRGLKNTEIHSVLSKTKERICTAELVVGIIVNTVSKFLLFKSSSQFLSAKNPLSSIPRHDFGSSALTNCIRSEERRVGKEC